MRKRFLYQNPDPSYIQSGDAIYLKSTNPEEPYDHTVVIFNKAPLSASLASVIGDNPIFSGLGGTVFTIEADSSWGSGKGVMRKKWLYETTTKQWAKIEDGTFVFTGNAPEFAHTIQGIYRAK